MRTTIAFFTVLAVICNVGVGQFNPNIIRNTRLSVFVHLKGIGYQYGIENQWLGTKG
jgi:hypothetical protein